MKISIYTSLFNLKSYFPNYKKHLENYCSLADEVIVSTIKDEGDTYSELIEYSKMNNKIKVILTDLKPYTPPFDGQLKDAALQKCSGDVLIGLDMDEMISSHNLDKWKEICKILLQRPEMAIWVPVINLYNDNLHFTNISKKWYVHKPGLKRGVVNFAKRPDGTHDTEKSDSCELLDQQGNLVSAAAYVPFGHINNTTEMAQFLKDNNCPFIWHLGHIDKTRRVQLNWGFWHRQWSAENGQDVKIPMSEEEIGEKEVFEHGLPLWS